MYQTLCINHRFNGPPGIGNGGYVSGLLARHVSGPAEVRLHRPAPLDQPLTIGCSGDGQVALWDGEQLIASARPSMPELTVPDPPSFNLASAARADYPGFRKHPFPTCFVCGPQRAAGDGLRIFPGPIAGREIFAAPWIPHPALSDTTRHVRPEFVWAALDCPGGIAAMASEPRPMLLGQMAVVVARSLPVHERYVTTGQLLSHDGRKYFTASAIFSESGTLHASARAIWIEPRYGMFS